MAIIGGVLDAPSNFVVSEPVNSIFLIWSLQSEKSSAAEVIK